MDQKYDEGIEKGRAEGIELGIQKGMTEGEKKAKLEIAKHLLVSGMDIDTIMSITKLTKKDIEGLK